MKVIFLTLFLPLGVTLILMALAVYTLFTRKLSARKRVVALLTAAFFLLYIASTPVFGRMLSAGLAESISGRELADPANAQAIIVLTGDMVNAGPIGWLPSRESYQRLAVAYELQRLINLRLPVIISGGYTKGVHAPSEAAVAAGFFSRNRPEITPTELEETSTNTFESARQLAPVLAKREAHDVFLVTSDIHMLRALASYRARGVDPIPFPAISLPAPMGVRAFLPSAYGLTLTHQAVYEYYALAAYLLSGRVGFSDVFYHSETNQ